MRNFAEKQFIYEINTAVWLTELSHHYGQPITLDTIPDEALDAIARPGIDYIWLMGIWQRSAYGLEIALKWKHEYQPALPDLTDKDIIGSAYAIGDYRVADAFGGREALAHLRQRLRQRGLKLILDFVPNHVAADHPWLETHPEYIVQGSSEDVLNRPNDFFTYKDSAGCLKVFAHGRDPYFPGWSDTAQLNIFNPALRKAVRALLLDIASQCDGLRCDMAMLLLKEIFSHTWKGYVPAPPAKEYWVEMTKAIKQVHPDFLFMAEVYWHKEYELLLQGFDYCYDKVFYDRVLQGNVQQLRQHLVSELAYQQRLVRFLENHDEPRAYETLGALRSYPAATLLCTLPGGTLLHEGQFIGRRVKLPVQINRAPTERRHPKLEAFYNQLLREIENPIYHNGSFYLFQVNPAAKTNQSNQQLLAYGWYNEAEFDYRLIIVNLTEQRAQGRIDMSAWTWLEGRRWRLFNALDNQEFSRQGGALSKDGMLVDLDPYESFIFRFELEDMPRRVPAGGYRGEVF